MKRFVHSIACILILSGARMTFAQICCGVGSAHSGRTQVAINEGRIFLNSALEYAASGNQYTGSEVSIDPQKRFLRRAELRLTLGYGITENLFADVSSNLLWLSKQFSISTPDGILKDAPQNLGLGDGTLGIKYRILPFTVLNLQEFLTGVHVVIPWGPTETFKDGVKLPRDVQTGKGEWKIGGILSYFRSFPNQKIGFNSEISGNFSLGNLEDYSTGDEYALLVGGVFGPLLNVRLTSTLGFQHKRGSTGNRMENFLDFIPGIEYQVGEDYSFGLSGEIPAWRKISDDRGNPATSLSKAYVLRISSGVFL